VIELVHFRGLALGEVAELTGLPLGTVKSRLHYATQSLRLALEELEVVPEGRMSR
jgi:RNA polymerase sigma-70 factor (ECF subfamily)